MVGVDDYSVGLDEQKPCYKSRNGWVFEALDPEKLFTAEASSQSCRHLVWPRFLNPDKIQPFSIFYLFIGSAKRGVFLDGEDARVGS